MTGRGHPNASEPADNKEAGADSRGLFDGFEGYLTPTASDYQKVLTDGMVVLDTNVLLNLYRYTSDARDDLLAVLGSLTNRLWVPHHVIMEFWRNRERVLRDPRDTKKAVRELSEYRDRATRALQAWANRVSLPAEHLKELLDALTSGFDVTISGVDHFADNSATDWSRDTSKDPVVHSLEEILKNRVGPPLDEPSHKAAVLEGLRRVSMREPPGYMDKKKDDDGAAGDYLVWEQVLVETARRHCDVLFVTGDVKEDWWREEGGERRGARIELIDEMRQRSGGRLFMVRPTQLLGFARTVLEVTVRDESVQDAERVDRFLSETDESLPAGGWNLEAFRVLLTWLTVEAPVQEAAIRMAASQAGYVSREQVYALGKYPEDRSLRGFTRPISRITQILRDNGILSDEAVDLLWAVYNADSPAVGWAAGFRIHGDAFPQLADYLDAARDSTSSPSEEA